MFAQRTCNWQSVGDVAGFEAEVVFFPVGIDAITAFKDHFNSAFFFLQIPVQRATVKLFKYIILPNRTVQVATCYVPKLT